MSHITQSLKGRLRRWFKYVWRVTFIPVPRKYAAENMDLDVEMAFSSECDSDSREFCLRHNECLLAHASRIYTSMFCHSSCPIMFDLVLESYYFCLGKNSHAHVVAAL